MDCAITATGVDSNCIFILCEIIFQKWDTDIGMPDEGAKKTKPGFLARMKEKNEEANEKDD